MRRAVKAFQDFFSLRGGDKPAEQDRPVVLMHIAKTAGTAARLALMDALGGPPAPHWVEPEQLAAAWRLDPWNLAGARLISGHFGTDFVERLPFAKFRATFMRDPVERCLSHFVFTRDLDLSRVGPELASRLSDSRGQPLETLLASEDPFVAAQYRNHQARQFAGRGPLEPGALEADYGPALIDRAMGRAAQFDFIGIRERHVKSLQLLFARLGLAFEADRYKAPINASRDSPRNLQTRSDERLRRLIRKHNPIDMALYETLSRRLFSQLEEAGLEH